MAACRRMGGVLGSWTSGNKVSASEGSKQVNQRHAAQYSRSLSHPLHFRHSTPRIQRLSTAAYFS